MELEEKLKAAKVPMIVVHFDENFETTYTEAVSYTHLYCQAERHL